MKKILDNKWIQFIISATIVIFIYKCLNNLSDIKRIISYLFSILFPCILGVIIALFLYKPVRKFQGLYEKIKIPTSKALPLSIATVFLIIIALLTIAINFIVPPIYKNIEDLALNLPIYYRAIGDFIIEHEIQNFIPGEMFQDLFQKFLPNILNLDMISKYIGIIGDIANYFITIFLSIVLSVYLLLEKDKIFVFFKKIQKKFFNNSKANIVITYIKKSVMLFYSYFRGLFIDAIVMGALCTVIFTFFDLPYAAVLGLVVAIGNLIPFFGPIVSAVIVFIISAITLGPITAIWLLLVQLIVGQIDANLIQPKILSNSTGISPLLVLLSVTIFGSLWGTAGMILGVPLCAILKMIVSDYLDDGKIDGK